MKSKANGGKQKKKRGLLRYLALAAIVTSLATSGTLARYSSLLGGTINVQVASFTGDGTVNFTVEMDGQNMYPGSETAVDFIVQNYTAERDCEVAIRYEVRVTSTENLPLVFSLEGDKEGDDSVLANQGEMARVGSGEWAATGGKLPAASGSGPRRQHRYQLAVKWPEDMASNSYSDEIDKITVTVKAEQANPTTG